MLLKDFHSNNLRFREFESRDRLSLEKIASDERFSFVGLPDTSEGIDTFFERAKERISKTDQNGLRAGFRLAVTQRNNNEVMGLGVIGTASLKNFGEVRDIAYFIAPEYWGRGLGREVAYSMAYAAFQYYDLDELYATTASDNEASRKVLKSIGMNNVGTDLALFESLGSEVERQVYKVDRGCLKQPLALPLEVHFELSL